MLASTRGPDSARAVLAHEPGTKTLERYYVDAIPHIDVGGIMTDGTNNSDQLRRITDNSLSLEALDDAAVRRVYGPALKASSSN